MTLFEALEIPRGVTAFVGGGGKTTAILRLGAELSGRGHVLIATTTRIYPPNLPILINPDPKALERAFAFSPIVAVGRMEGDKLGPPENLGALSAACDYALIEADGARGLPLKAPAAHEPEIPAGAALVVAVMGVDGIGRAVSAVHRPERYAPLIGKPLSALVTPADAARVLASPDGQKKGVSCAWRALLNKADGEAERVIARACAKRISGIAVICSLQCEPVFIEIWRDGQCVS